MTPNAPPPRFLADAMLERLARWLRVLGFDAECAAGPDAAIMSRAAGEARHLLTRDRRLAADAHAPRLTLLVRSRRTLSSSFAKCSRASTLTVAADHLPPVHVL